MKEKIKNTIEELLETINMERGYRSPKITEDFLKLSEEERKRMLSEVKNPCIDIEFSEPKRELDYKHKQFLNGVSLEKLLGELDYEKKKKNLENKIQSQELREIKKGMETRIEVIRKRAEGYLIKIIERIEQNPDDDFSNKAFFLKEGHNFTDIGKDLIKASAYKGLYAEDISYLLDRL